MSLHVREYAVRNDAGREVGVNRYQTGIAQVTWIGGDTRTVRFDNLPTLIFSVDALVKAGTNDEMMFVDNSGRKTYVKVEDGTFYGSCSTLDGFSDPEHGVPWADLKKALKKIMEV